MDERVGAGGVTVEAVSRVQLRAVVAGLAIVVAYTVCMGLSWGIGLSTFRPTVEHARGLTLANFIWGALAVWLSLFFGSYVAALVGRSAEPLDGVLHGLVVWGVTAGIALLFVMAILGGLLAMASAASTELRATDAPAIQSLVRTAATTVWFAWAGIVGGLFASAFGGWLGAREEHRVPRGGRLRAPTPASPPTVLRPQPTV